MKPTYASHFASGRPDPSHRHPAVRPGPSPRHRSASSRWATSPPRATLWPTWALPQRGGRWPRLTWAST